MPADPDLSPKEAAFVRHYLVMRNATKAYIAAGYAEKGARQNASRLMSKDYIQAAIAEGEAAAAKRAALDLDTLVAEYTKLGMSGMSKFLRIDAQGQPVIDLSGCTKEDLDLLAEVTVETFMDGRGEDAREVKRIKIKPYDRYTALAKLATYLGLDRGINGDNPSTNALDELLRQIQERHTALPVKPQGPLGSKGLPWKH